VEYVSRGVDNVMLRGVKLLEAAEIGARKGYRKVFE
jgi:hypothetical protein